VGTFVVSPPCTALRASAGQSTARPSSASRGNARLTGAGRASPQQITVHSREAFGWDLYGAHQRRPTLTVAELAAASRSSAEQRKSQVVRLGRRLGGNESGLCAPRQLKPDQSDAAHVVPMQDFAVLRLPEQCGARQCGAARGRTRQSKSQVVLLGRRLGGYVVSPLRFAEQGIALHALARRCSSPLAYAERSIPRLVAPEQFTGRSFV